MTTDGGDDLNPYGEAWAAAHNAGITTAAAFLAVESMNSDNDPTGSTNLVEITANAQPGWTPGPNNTLFNLGNAGNGDVANTNQLPPGNIGNVLDPPATPVNQPPVLDLIGPQTASEGVLLTFTATATDPEGGALTFVGGDLPTGATVTPAGVFTWTPSFDQSGNYNVTITVTDNGSPAASDFETFTITVGDVNRPPVLNPIGPRTVDVGQLLSFTVTATDPDGNALAITGSDLPAGATLVDNHDGTAAFNWTPAVTGNFSPTITVTDNGSPAAVDSETFTITVGNVNRPPVLNPIGNQQAVEGQLLTFTATATDPDGDANALRFTATGLPAGATFVDNLNGSATFNWTPGSGQSDNFSVTVTVTDGGTPPASDSETFTISVGNVNRPPVLNLIGNRTVTEGDLLTIMVTATDPDGGPLSFTATDVPTGATFVDNNNGTATFNWTPAVGQAGDFAVTVTVSDNGSPALSDSETFTLTVRAASPETGFDLNIRRFRATEEVRVGRRVIFRLEVRNVGGVEGEASATLVGMQNGAEVHRDTITVTAPAGRGTEREENDRSDRVDGRRSDRRGDGEGSRARFSFPSFTPTAAGTITWTVTIDDANPDTATDTTRVRERRRGEEDDD